MITPGTYYSTDNNTYLLCDHPFDEIDEINKKDEMMKNGTFVIITDLHHDKYFGKLTIETRGDFIHYIYMLVDAEGINISGNSIMTTFLNYDYIWDVGVYQSGTEMKSIRFRIYGDDMLMCNSDILSYGSCPEEFNTHEQEGFSITTNQGKMFVTYNNDMFQGWSLEINGATGTYKMCDLFE